jgi:hypothetical protein
MRVAGIWDDVMEQLPPHTQDAEVSVIFRTITKEADDANHN